MIKESKVKIELNRGNLPYYSNRYGIDGAIGDSIEIDIDMLPISSGVEISAVCDFCGSESKIKYKLYRKSFDKGGGFACGKKCAAKRTKDCLMSEYGVSNIAQVPSVKEKIKKNNLEKFGSESYFGSESGKEKNKEALLEKYGVDNPMKSIEIREKAKKSNLENWGVEWTLQSRDIRDRIAKTNLERWGTETPSKCEEIKSKIIKTNLEKWGGRSPMCNDAIKEKSAQTMFKNWGVYSPSHSDEIRDRSKKTNLEKWGAEYPSQSENVREKIKKSNLEKWGAEHVHQSDAYRIGSTNIGKNAFYIGYKGNKISIFKCDNGKDHSFEISTDNFYSRSRNNVSLCTVCHPIGDAISHLENELLEFISSIYGGEIVQSYRDGLEIDIYLPEMKIGFEFNGLYWHSEKYREKDYHLEKTAYFEKKGIHVIHVWEDDWRFKSEIVRSLISNKICGTNQRIFARSCEIRTIEDRKIAKGFLERCHIQGADRSSLKIGLFFEGELVSIMTFDRFEGRKRMEAGAWNLSRFCNKLNTSVVGGASRLLKYFKESQFPERIVSYADRDWSQGSLYYKLGFSMVGEPSPDYKYIVDGKRVHKSNFKKSKRGYSSTESEYAKISGAEKIWDCGKIKFSISYL